MRYLQPILVVLFLRLTFCSLGNGGNDNGTIATMDNFTEVSINTETEVTLSEDEIVLEKWRNLEKTAKSIVSEAVKLILPMIIESAGDVKISSKCTSSLMKMIYGVKSMKSWAFQMLDSFGKIPNGVLNGYMSSLGDYDGCLAVKVPGSPFRGEYCSIFITPPLPKRKPFQVFDKIHPLFVNFTKKGTLMYDASQQAHFLHLVAIRTSVCVPSTCSRQDIETVVDTALGLTGLSLDAKVPSCEVAEPLVFSKSDIGIICFLSVIGLLVFIATVTDVVLTVISKEKRRAVAASSTVVRCLMCFSAYANTQLILKKDSSPHSIKVFHGMKVVTLLWVMLHHTYFMINFQISVRMKNMRDFGKAYAFQAVDNAYFSVETFFFISAVLLAYGRMKFSGKHIGIPKQIIRRVWRLTPPQMLVIALSLLVPHMGSGPGWKETILPLTEPCKVNWWTNLIFINNFITYKETCHQWLWYIAADTHLYILGLFVLAPMKSNPKLGHGLNIALFVAGTASTAAAHVYYNGFPTVIYAFLHPDDWNFYIDYSHLRTYTHITTCCIGIYVGCILAERKKITIPKALNVFGWFAFTLLGLLCVYGTYNWNQGNIPSLAISTLYVCTSKVLWSLALSYVTIACFTGNGGIITSVLSWSAFVPLSRLTYVAYLIHPVLFWMYVASARVSLPTDHVTVVYRYIANVVISYCFAYVISLLFECPFMGLERVMFAKRVQPKASLKSNPEENSKFGNHQIKSVDDPISTISITKIETEGP